MKNYTFDYSVKTEPFPHQVEAINFIGSKEQVALFDEMGLGKTKIVIDALLPALKDKSLDCALIICKKSLIKNWEEEITKHTNLPAIVLRGNEQEKGMKFMVYSPFYIINYDAVISEEKRLAMMLKIKKYAIVLDESHRIKDPYSKTARAILALAPLAKRKVIISGTPVANKPQDLWAQFYFLDSGQTLGSDYEAFKKRFKVNLKKNRFDQQSILWLREVISGVSMRRLKKDVLELPDKIFKDVYVNLEGEQLRMYDTLKEELSLEIQNMDGEQIIDNAESILKRLIRLNQIASNPRLIDESYDDEPVKFKLLDKLVADVIARKEKVIIWTSFVDNIISLKKRYQQFGAVTIYGRMIMDDRNKAKNKFCEDPSCKVLIANPAAAREGLTLTAANNAIYLDRSFNLVDYIQSQDRIHRISQKKNCLIINIVANGTVDKYIDEIIYKKQSIANFIQGDSDVILPTNTRDFLTKEELTQILGG